MTHFGVQLSTAMCSMDDLRTAWTRVETLGYEWISGQDHFYTAREPTAGSFEALSCHAALAVLTERPRIGCLVYSAGYRHPAVMANAFATIDHLSGGRLEVGMGAGWMEEEYIAYGIPFEPPAVRLRRLKESVEVMRSLWTRTSTDYDGEFYRLTGARCDPKPLQRPPRIWIGAKGAHALKVAAAVGDGWNANFLGADAFAEGARSIREIAPTPDRFALSASTALVAAEGAALADAMQFRYGSLADLFLPGALTGSVDQITDKVGSFVDAGADWIIIAVRPPFEFDELELFAASVVPHFRR